MTEGGEEVSDGMMEAARAQREWEKETGTYYLDTGVVFVPNRDTSLDWDWGMTLTLTKLRRYAVKEGGTTHVLPRSGYVVLDFKGSAELWAPVERPEGVSKRTVQQFKLVSRS